MRVAFKALIKTINNKSLVSCDKETWVTVIFDSANETEVLNGLNELQVADKMVMVVIMDEKDAVNVMGK